jgi:cell division protein FtsN
MTQDFAKIRPEPLLERKAVQAPPSWSLLVSGVAIGIVVGILGCVLFYLSGAVPPMPTANPLAASPAIQAEQGASISRAAIAADAAEIEPIEAKPELTMDFYTALPDYQVVVPDTQVELTEQQRTRAAAPEQQFATGYLLQSGAFQQRALAMAEVAHQQSLGIDVFITEEVLPGRTLFLVQSGPYMTSMSLAVAETALRNNNISSLRLSVEQAQTRR